MSVYVEPLKRGRRADYTFKMNTVTGRHGWLRLTPAYSLKIVEEIISAHPRAKRVLDPFCGTGTTALTAVYHGRDAVTVDINPFLVWLADVKTRCFSPSDVVRTAEACREVTSTVTRKSVDPWTSPPIHNIQRWWDADTLEYLRLLRAGINAVAASDTPVHALLLVAFYRTMIKLSNAAFNHQSMSFKEQQQLRIDLGVDYNSVFTEDVHFVLEGASENPQGSASVLLGDARYVDRYVHVPVDLVVTSPPYANRISYIRELRPYMYWLGFLASGREAGELDWQAIGGTWGIATSRLANWKRPDNRFVSEHLESVIDEIRRADNPSGAILANYLVKYFDDMWEHFCNLTSVLSPGAEVHYIIGNSKFYNTVVATEHLYAEMLERLGFEQVRCVPIRKRNSKKELIEFDVTGKWRG